MTFSDFHVSAVQVNQGSHELRIKLRGVLMFSLYTLTFKLNLS